MKNVMNIVSVLVLALAFMSCGTKIEIGTGDGGTEEFDDCGEQRRTSQNIPLELDHFVVSHIESQWSSYYLAVGNDPYRNSCNRVENSVNTDIIIPIGGHVVDQIATAARLDYKNAYPNKPSQVPAHIVIVAKPVFDNAGNVIKYIEPTYVKYLQ